jgi:hypothetical protein
LHVCFGAAARASTDVSLRYPFHVPLLNGHLITAGQPDLEERRLCYGSDGECGKSNSLDYGSIGHNATGSETTHNGPSHPLPDTRVVIVITRQRNYPARILRGVASERSSQIRIGEMPYSRHQRSRDRIKSPKAGPAVHRASMRPRGKCAASTAPHCSIAATNPK